MSRTIAVVVLAVLFRGAVNGQGVPSIANGGIVNATGYQTKLAPGVVFVVFGSNLGPAGTQAGVAPDYPTALGGVSITFTPAAGGGAINARLVYVTPGQVAGVLPSTIAPGTYAVRLTFNGQTSGPQNVTVVARSYGIATANSAGTGTAQATIGNVNQGLSLVRFTSGSVTFNGISWTLTPAHGGDTLVFWGTGGGADIANDTGGTSGDQTAAGNFMVTIGDRQIRPLYAGTSSGFPGLWQINFRLPDDIAPDCFAAAHVTAGGESSNVVIVPIAAAGQSACSDPQLSTAALARFDAGGSITFGAFAVAKVTDTPSGITQESASGAFARYSAAAWAISRSGPKFGPCAVYDRTYPLTGRDPATPDGFLDAGARLPISGPNLPAGAGLSTTATPFGPSYLNIPAAGTLTAGTYTISGNGGSQIGPFSASSMFPARFDVTNWNAVTVIDRSRPLTFNWTGTGFDNVSIIANSSTVSSGSVRIVTITCSVPAGPGTYSVSPSALAYLQPAGVGGTSFGNVSVQGANATPFTAPLVNGGQIDGGSFGGNLGLAKNIAVQ